MTNILLTIAGSAILLMLGIIGYFIARNDKRQELTNKELANSLNKLSGTISGLNAIVLVFEEKHNSLEKDYYKHKEKYHE